MKLKKRLTSLALSLSVAASLFTAVPITANAAEMTYTPDKAILENILNGDRHFVIDTLVGDSGFHTDFSTNPHALVNYIGSENTMMDNVLSQYQNKDDPNYSATYKAAVDVMEKVYNSDEYAQTVADFVTEFGADLLSSFSTDAANFASDLTYSKSQLNYESILKEALASDYTASDGTELSTKEIELENLERLEKGLKCLKAFQAFALSYGKANNYDEKDENFKNKYDYFKTYLTSYSDSIEKALSSFEKVMKIDNADEINTFLTLMGTVAQYDLYCEEIQAVGSDIPQYAATYFVSDDDLKKMKFDKSVISGVSNTLSSYMFINSIATQRDSISDTLTRMSQTANPSLKPILVDFASEVGNAGDAKLMGYQTLMKTLRDESAVIDFSKWSAKKITDKFAVMKKMKKEALNSALGKTISSATAVAGISSWCADKAASFGDTCKKTYELKYLRTLIAQTVTTYKSDLSVYNSDKTEGNAGKVLDDLLMLQKLRLRGEKIAYEMTQGQWNSPLGRLLASGTLGQDKMLMNYLDEAYQARVDAFIGASAMPFSTDSITVGSGEQLTIEYDSSCGGLVGRYTKADKTMYGIGELQYKIANGVMVNSGGTLLTISTSNNCGIPFINNNGGTVLVSSNTQGITEFSQDSGTLVLGSGTFDIGNLYLSGGEVKSSKGASLKCNTLSISSTNVSNVALDSKTMIISGYTTVDDIKTGLFNQVDGNATINGNVNINGDAVLNGSISQIQDKNFNIIGDISGNSNTKKLGNLNINGVIKQSISTKLNVNNLSNNNKKGLTVNDVIVVNGAICDTQSIIGNKNIELSETAYFPKSTFYGNITLNGFTNHLPTTLKGTVYLKSDYTLNNSTKCSVLENQGRLKISDNSVTFTGTIKNSNGDVILNNAGFTMNGVMIFNSGNLTLNGSRLTQNGLLNSSSNYTQINIDDKSKLIVKGDFITNGNLQCNGSLYTYADFTNNGTATINEFIVIANTPVAINGKNITVESFQTNGNKNISLNTIINTQNYTLNNKRINTQNIKVLNGLYISKNKTYNDDVNVDGDLTINGVEMVTNKNLTVTGNIIIKNGGRLIAKNDITLKGNLSLENNATLSTKKGLTLNNGDINVINKSELLLNGLCIINNSSKIFADDTSKMLFNKLTIMQNVGNITSDGIIKFGGDAYITSAVMLGNGIFELQGDLNGNSLSINKPKSFNIIGKTPQVISCSSAIFDNLNIDNPCKTGVNFTSQVYYCGTLNTHNSNITGTITQKQEEK